VTRQPSEVTRVTGARATRGEVNSGHHRLPRQLSPWNCQSVSRLGARFLRRRSREPRVAPQTAHAAAVTGTRRSHSAGSKHQSHSPLAPQSAQNWLPGTFSSSDTMRLLRSPSSCINMSRCGGSGVGDPGRAGQQAGWGGRPSPRRSRTLAIFGGAARRYPMDSANYSRRCTQRAAAGSWNCCTHDAQAGMR
jgi:hypothetical protein